jgi:spore coat polysaccharide biosynthesis protein SpsF (cytidylyltransferase family)
MSSTRLPGKVMQPLNKEPMIYWQIQRILRAPEVSKIIVATSTDSSDDPLVEYLSNRNIDVYRGSLKDVFSRFKSIIDNSIEYDAYLRLTADCPLTMPNMISEMLGRFWKEQFDYFSNCRRPTFPDGLDIEIFTCEAFRRLSELALSEKDLEHVTLKFREDSSEFFSGEFSNPIDLSSLRWTVDYPEDFEFVSRVFHHFKGSELEISIEDILNFVQNQNDPQS